jgi:hypothetical protein
MNQHRVYDEHERAAIDNFKDKYMEATTSAGRKNIAQLENFPALFNYWKSRDVVYNKKEIEMKSNVRFTYIFRNVLSNSYFSRSF